MAGDRLTFGLISAEQASVRLGDEIMKEHATALRVPIHARNFEGLRGRRRYVLRITGEAAEDVIPKIADAAKVVAKEMKKQGQPDFRLAIFCIDRAAGAVEIRYLVWI